MSRTIDQRIVQMALDNSNFEKNAKQSLGTLDKLSTGIDSMSKNAKKSLGSSTLGTAVKGMLSTVQNATGDSLAQVQQMFNNMSSIGERVLDKVKDKIADTLVGGVSNALRWYEGHFGQMSAARAGFGEFETKLDSIQSIMMNVEDEGKGLKEVSAALDKLNKYADDTVYNFAQMTQAIGTFTAAGVNLDESVAAIKGLSNVAAGLGVNNESLVRAERQIAQSLQIGYLTLGDWNSMVNSGLGGEYMQKALLDTAKEYYETIGDSNNLKIINEIKDGSRSLRDSLKDGVINSQILVKTFNQFAEDESLLKAATEVRTFTKLVDSLGEAIGSGWAKTWELVIGDMEHGKKLWTGINDVVAKYFDTISEGRNRVLEDFLGTGITGFVIDDGTVAMGNKNWYNLVDIIVDACRIVTGAVGGVKTALKRLFIPEAGTTEYYDMLLKLSNKVQAIRDTLKKVADDIEKFRDGGYSVFGDFMKYPIKIANGIAYVIKFVGGLFNIILKGFKGVFSALASIFKWALATVSGFFDILGIRTKGLQEVLIIVAAAISRLASMAVGVLTSIADSMFEFSTLGVSAIFDWFDTLKEKLDFIPWEKIHAFLSTLYWDIVRVAVGWTTFGDDTNDPTNFIVKGVNALSKAVAGLKEWLSSLKPVIEHIFIKTVEAMVPVISVASKIFSGIVYAVKVFISSLSGFKGTFSAIARIAIQIVRIGSEIFDKILGKNGGKAKTTVKSFGDVIYWLGTVVSRTLTKVADFLENVKTDDIFDWISNAFIAIKKTFWFVPWDKIGSTIDKLRDSLSEKGLVGTLKSFGSSIAQVFKNLRDAIKEHGGGISGLVKLITETIKNSFSDGVKTAQNNGNKIINFMKPIFDWLKGQFDRIVNLVSNDPAAFLKNVFKTIITPKIFKWLYEIFSTPRVVGRALAQTIGKLGDLFESTGDLVDQYRKNMKLDALKSIATSVLIIVGAIVVLSLIPNDKISAGLSTIVMILGGFIAVYAIMNAMSKTANPKTISSISGFIIKTAISVMLIAGTVKKLGKLKPEVFKQGLTAVASIFGLIAALYLFVGTVGKSGSSARFKGFAKALIGIALAIQMMTLPIIAISLISMVSNTALSNAITSILTIIGAVAAMYVLFNKSDTAGNGGKVVRGIIGLAFAMNLMVAPIILLTGTIALLQALTGSTAAFGMAFASIIAIIGVMMLFVGYIQKTASTDPAKIEATAAVLKAIRSIAISMVIAAMSMVVISKVGSGNLESTVKAMLAMTGVMIAMFAVMAIFTSINTGPDAALEMQQLSKVITSIAGAFIEIAVAIAIVSAFGGDNLAGSVAAISALAAIMIIIMGFSAILSKKGALSGMESKVIKDMTKVITRLAIAALIISVSVGIIAAAVKKIGIKNTIIVLSAIVIGVSALVTVLALVAKIAPVTKMVALSGALLSLALSMTALAISALMFGVSLLTFAAALPNITKHLVAFATALGTSIVVISKILADGKDDITAAIDAVITAIGVGLLAGLINVLAYITDNGPEIVRVLVGSIGVIIVGFLVGVGALVGAALGGILAGIMDALVIAVYAIIPRINPVITAIVDLIIAIIDGIAYALSTRSEGLAESLIYLLESILDVISELLVQLGAKLAGFGKFLWEEWLLPGFKSLLPNLKREWNEFTQAIGEFAKKVWEGIEGAFKGLAGLLGDIGKFIIDGIIGGLTTVWEDWIQKPADGLKSFGKKIIDGFKSIFKIKSPSQVMHDEVGVYLGQGLTSGTVDGAEESMPEALDRLDNLYSQLVERIDLMDAAKELAASPIVIKESDYSRVMRQAAEAGQMMAQGEMIGYESEISKTMPAVANRAADKIIKCQKVAMDMHSPSIREKEIGELAGEGLLIGFEESVENGADDTAESSVASLTDSFDKALSGMDLTDGLSLSSNKFLVGLKDKFVGNLVDENFGDSIKKSLGIGDLGSSLSESLNFDTSSFDKLLDMDMNMSGITNADFSGISEGLSNANLDATATVTPVLDTNSMASINDGAMEQFNSLEQLVKMMNTYNNDNTDVIRQLIGMRNDIMSLSASMLKMRVVMDTGATVGAMESEMDRRLGLRQSLRMRGVN